MKDTWQLTLILLSLKVKLSQHNFLLPPYLIPSSHPTNQTDGLALEPST